MSATDIVSQEQLPEAMELLPQWRYRAGSLVAVFTLPSSGAALDLLGSIGTLAEEANHHPDVDWRYQRLFVRLSSHDAGDQVTVRDTKLASRISAAASAAGAVAEPALSRSYELAIDTDNPEEIAEVWARALGYERTGTGELVDPFGRGPSIWFQQTETPHPNRLHVDAYVSLSERDAALAAVEGQNCTLDTANAPRWVIVTDAQGNRLCLCTEAGQAPEERVSP